MSRYILMANQAKAVLFKEDRKKYSLVKKFESEVGRLKESEIFTSRAGSSQTNYTADQTTVSESHFMEEKLGQFSHSLFDYIHKNFDTDQIKSLIVISGPAFMGALRKKIPANFEKKIEKEVTKNFYTEKDHELKAYIEAHEI